CEMLQDLRLIVRELQMQQPALGVADADAVEEGDDLPRTLGQMGRACGTGQLGGALKYLAKQPPNPLDDAADHRDQREHQHDQQYPLPSVFSCLRVVDQSYRYGDQVA